MGEYNYKLGEWVTVVNTGRFQNKKSIGYTFQLGRHDDPEAIHAIHAFNAGKERCMDKNNKYCINHTPDMIRYATLDEIRAAGATPPVSNGVKRKLSEISGKAVVHCNTLEEIRQLAPLLMTLEPYQRNGHSIEKLIEGHKGDICCYNIHDNRAFTSGKGTLASYKSQGYTIYPASDFIETGLVTGTKGYDYGKSIDIGQPVMVTEDNWYEGMKVLFKKDPTPIGTIVEYNKNSKLVVNWSNGVTIEYKPGDGNLYIYQEQTSNYSQTNIKTSTNGNNKQERPKSQSNYTGRTVNLQAVTATITTGQRPRGRILSGRIQEATTRSGYLRNKVLTIK